MKRMKKTLCILLSMLMVLAMIPGTALATEQEPEPVQMTIFSDSPLLDAEGNLIAQHETVQEYITIRLSGNPEEMRTRYAYIGTYVGKTLKSAEPITDGFTIRYLKSEEPTFDNPANGITAKRVDSEEATHNNCRYAIVVNCSAYNNFTEGCGIFDLKPYGRESDVYNATIEIEKGNSGEVVQRTIFSDTPLLYADGNSIKLNENVAVQDILRIQLSGNANEMRTRYAYIGTYEGGILRSAEPIIDGFTIRYLLSEEPSFDNQPKGITANRVTTGDDAINNCRYEITINCSAYNNFTEGCGIYDIKPFGRENGVYNASIEIEKGNGGGNNQNSNLILVDSNSGRINDHNVVYDTLPGLETEQTKTFYIAYDAGASGLNITPHIIDHYNTMHAPYDSSQSERPQIEVPPNAINITAVTDDNPLLQLVRAGAGFDKNNNNVYVFSAEINSAALKQFTYLKSGIVRGNLDIKQGDESVYNEEIAVCSSGFVKEANIFGGNSSQEIMFMDVPHGTDIRSKKVNLYEPLDSNNNKIYLAVRNNLTGLTLKAYSKYFGANGNYVYESVNAVPIQPENGDDDNVYTTYTINLSQVYGHNDLILVAEAQSGENKVKTTLEINKAIQFEFDTDAFAVAEDISDYMNVAQNIAFGNPINGSVLKKEYQEDNGKKTTLLIDEDKGARRSSNMPYNGGYYGTVIKLADGYRLKDIVATGYDETGNEVDTHLSYVINQNIFYKVVDKRANKTVNEDAFRNFNNFQIPRRNYEAGEYLAEIDLGLAEYSYDKNTQKYRIDAYNPFEETAVGYYNFTHWLNEAFGPGNYEVELINACIYYDIFYKDSEVNSVQNLYEALDKVGTIKFVTEKDSKYNFAVESNKVGIKPSDDNSSASWGDYGFGDFACNEENGSAAAAHEQNLHSFNGDEVEKVVGAFDFRMAETDNFRGMVDVYIPVPENVTDHSSCKVYWMNEGNPVPMTSRYVDGYMVFTTSHFSEYVLVADESDIEAVPVTPSIPGGLPATSADKVTQSGDATTADLSGSTTSKGGETTTTVDQATADKLVETAVKNNSEEIVINAVTKNESAASSTKAAEVVLAGDTLQNIAEKTDADVVVKTNVAEVKLDNKTAEAVASQTGEGETVSIITEKVKEEAKEVQFELKIVTSSGKVISDFDGGNVAVTVNVPKSLSDKKVVCVYIDEKGYMHKVEGTLNADGTYTFNTGHFSTYALMDEGEAEAAIEAQKEVVKALKPTLRSSQVKTKSGKKAIKLTWKGCEDIQLDGIEIYRSLKKSSGYGKKPFYTTTKTSYLNTSVKAGRKYYYKVRGFVTIDGEKVYTQYSTKAWRTVK